MSKFEVSGLVGGDVSIPLGQGSFNGLQFITVNIPAGRRLFVNITRFDFLDLDARFAISVNGTVQYISNDNDAQEKPNKRIFKNNSASTVEIELALGAFAQTGNVDLVPDDGWYVLFEIRK